MTKPITKAECEEVIEKLADKTLSFGCLIKGNATTPFVVYVGYNASQHCLQIPLTQALLFVDQVSSNIILGHPVLIGDVLEKIDRGVSGMPYIPLLNLWGKCGFDSSLQQILAEAEWHHKPGFHDEAEGWVNGVVYAKSPAADLFTFLKSIL